MPITPTPHHAASEPRATVVLIDREPLYRWFVTESLSTMGIGVLACSSLDEAAHVLRQARPVDLLMVDGALLDGRDGTGLRSVRERARSIPCVVLSDGDSGSMQPDAFAIAAKPVDSEAVATLVAAHLKPAAPAA